MALTVLRGQQEHQSINLTPLDPIELLTDRLVQTRGLPAIRGVASELLQRLAGLTASP